MSRNGAKDDDEEQDQSEDDEPDAKGEDEASIEAEKPSTRKTAAAATNGRTRSASVSNAKTKSIPVKAKPTTLAQSVQTANVISSRKGVTKGGFVPPVSQYAYNIADTLTVRHRW